ncbi:DUF2878 domain-containing protein [Pleionea sp. CnH1-48]|uniref:DUF2878 domain-containing protein n=1 Tax=Pleionea sp. CnH1-48 TaxID=2954494 RepID=UPI0020969AB9|nr:DUF2878 domain-containing protein [Pleionea sp. CnH1-48]MCO7226919.1 DUF2878 domain-containing protein [Pleionea sp. CnH1-48]
MLYQYSLSKLLSNFTAFQLGWLACAFWHDTRSVVVTAMLLMWLYHSEPWSKVRIFITIQCAVIGIFVDSILSYLGVLSFSPVFFLLPFWLVLLWFLFSSTLTISLDWLMRRPVYAFIAGSVFGPAAYWAGAQFEALQVAGELGYPILSIVWALLMLVFSGLIRLQPNHHFINRRSNS